MADNEPEKSNFIQIYRECFAAALHDSLEELHFRDFPSAEAYLIAERIARNRTDEYVQRRLSPDEYQKYQATDKALKTTVSIVGATGMEQILYWAEKLGICAPDDDVERIVDRVRRYCVAEHGLSRHQFDELDVYQVADILKLDAKAKGLGKPDETTPGAGQGDERVDGDNRPPAKPPRRELPSRRRRRRKPEKDQWFPYDHERIRSYMGSVPKVYKGQLTKLSKQNPKLRRNATRAECKRFGVRTAQFVYDVFLLHHLVEGRDD